MKNLTWKIVVLACTAMLCGTALYIYNGVQSAPQQFHADTKGKELSDADVGIVPASPKPRLPDFKTLVLVKPDTFSFEEASQPLPVATRIKTPDLLDQVAASMRQSNYELQRANDVAEQAQQQQKWDSMQAEFRAMNQQATLDDIEFDLEFQRLQSATQPLIAPRNDWTLKYNGFNNTWRYAPVNSSLQYNPFGNDWEFVPQP